MLISLFLALRRYGVPVTLRELMDLLAALQHRLAYADLERFYLLARLCLVKDEKHYDKFDRAFGAYFKGLENLGGLLEALIPEHWLRQEFERALTPEELRQIDSLGGLEQLIAAFRATREQAERAAAQEEEGEAEDRPGRDGLGGPGQRRSGRGRKVWERRQYRNLDDSVEIGTRNLKMALRRLRKFARAGRAEELDMDGTVRSTARNGGLLDIRMRPERRNQVKVLLFLDVGGSMDVHVRTCEKLFSAARSEFKRLESFYFHNFIYESVWKDNHRRTTECIPTWEVLNTHLRDSKVVFVGDATMAPYEITHAGGSVEHWNEEPGTLWMLRFTELYDKLIWINPTPSEAWEYAPSIALARRLVNGEMYPLTVRGLEEGMNALAR